MPADPDAHAADDLPATRKDLRLLAAELRAEMHERFTDQTRTVLLGQFGASVTLAALLIAAVKL